MNPRVLLVGFVTLVLTLGIGVVIVGNDSWVADASESEADEEDAAAGSGTETETASADAGHEHDTENPDHAAELQPDQPLDPATRDQLAAQLTEARDLAMRYPTVADATASGYVLAGGFAPLSGAHYVAVSAAGLSSAGGIDVQKPNSLIYDGTSADSEIVGLMYYGMSGEEQPEGFAGPNDHWHRHRGVCVKFGAGGLEVPFPADADVTREQCDEVEGSYMDETGWMVHAWVVPSWESPNGVFSHDNPNVVCADGTIETDAAGFCRGT